MTRWTRGSAKVLDFTGGDEILHRAGDVFDVHVGIDSMLVQKIDPVRPQAPERRLNVSPDVLRAAIHSIAGPSILETEFGCDHHLFAERFQCFTDQLFIGVRAIGLCGIKERYAALEGCTDQRDTRLLLYSRTKPEA